MRPSRFFALAFVLFGCEQIVRFVDQDYANKVVLGSETLHVVFSHNINGETHPCGCRKFPLGGLPQVAGVLHDYEKKGEVFYVDTGDLLFPSPRIPSQREKSLGFAAENLGRGMKKLGLKLFVPGDQDFALGLPFLNRVLRDQGLKALVSNATDQLVHQKWFEISAGPRRLIFLGVVEPEVLLQGQKSVFTDPTEALGKLFNQRPWGDAENTTFILLSHSGIKKDRQLAKRFGQLDWILGAHSQSFTRRPMQEGDTQIVQVLSQNHYLGVISFPPQLGTDNASFKIVEVSEKKAQLLTPNPFHSFIQKHKEKMTQLQEQEEGQLNVQAEQKSAKLPTYLRCLECHQKESRQWSETAHSSAFSTLMKVGQERDPQCIGCHALAYNRPQGFFAQKGQVISSRSDFQWRQYWEQAKANFVPETPVRQLSKNKRKALIQQWVAKDQKEKITHNFSHVQCLHCHDQSAEHPFSPSAPELSASQQRQQMTNRCLNCHTRDQSPQWYTRDAKGLPGELKRPYVHKLIKQVACNRPHK